MRLRPAIAAACALAALGSVVGCSDSDADSGSSSASTNAVTTTAAPIPVGEAPLLVEQIRPAIAAVEQQLGGPQRFFEVNATPALVNLFIAGQPTADGATTAVAYIYQAGELQPPAEPQRASGPTFGAAEVTFDETRVLANVVASLPGSNFRGFSAVGVDGGGVRYVVTVESTLGGAFEVTVGPSGAILGTNQQINPDITVPGS